MDDRELVAALIAEGKPAMRLAMERLPPEYLEGDGRIAYEFLVLHVKKYNVLPTTDTILTETGVMLLDAKEPAAFYIDAVHRRKLVVLLREKLDPAIDFLSGHDPVKALETIETAVREIRLQQITGSKVVTLGSLKQEVIDYYDRIAAGERGVLTPWFSVNEATYGFWEQDLGLFVARMGIGKCLDEDSELVDPISGVPHTLREVVADPALQQAFTWSRQQDIHAAPITAKVDTGRKGCLKVTFASGRSIITTPEHPFLTPEGWRPASELRLGATAALPATIPFPQEPVSLPVEEVDLMAVLLAEGSYSGHHTGFTTTDERVLSLMQDAADAAETDIQPRSEIDFDFVRRLGSSRENAIHALLRKHGMEGKKAVVKVIPDAIYRLPPVLLGRFLGLFWMCDGYVDGSGPAICLASERMIRQIQHLLLRFGVQSSVDYKQATCDGKKFDAWRLRVYASSYERFAGAVPLWGDKQERLRVFLEKDRNSNVGFPRVSAAFVGRVKEIVAGSAGRRNGNLLSQVRDRLGWSSCFSPKCLFTPHGDLHSLSLRSFEAFCDVYGCSEEFSWLWNRGIFWDVVERIADAGERKIYDLTMEPTSCFVANDILVHNTWASALIAHHAWDVQKKKVLYATTEMKPRRIAGRIICARLKIPYTEYTHGKMSPFQRQHLIAGYEEIEHDGRFHIVGGDFDFHINAFEAAIDTVQPDVVLLDGAYLLRVEGKTRTEKAANAFDELKRLTSRLNIPVIVTMQFNREVKANEAKSVKAEAIALTDVAGWNADLIFALIQTEEMKTNKEMIVKPLKVREGEGIEVRLHWDIGTMNFDEIGPVGKGGGGDADESGAVPDANVDAPF